MFNNVDAFLSLVAYLQDCKEQCAVYIMYTFLRRTKNMYIRNIHIFLKPSTSGALSNQTCSKGNIDAGKDNNLTAQTSSVDKEHEKKSDGCSNKNTNKIHNDRKSGEDKTSFFKLQFKTIYINLNFFLDIVMILSILKGITVDLKEIKANQQILIQHRPSTNDMAEQNFTVKPNLSVPFKTMDDFNDFEYFDRNLITIDEFRTYKYYFPLKKFNSKNLCIYLLFLHYLFLVTDFFTIFFCGYRIMFNQ